MKYFSVPTDALDLVSERPAWVLSVVLSIYASASREEWRPFTLRLYALAAEVREPAEDVFGVVEDLEHAGLLTWSYIPGEPDSVIRVMAEGPAE